MSEEKKEEQVLQKNAEKVVKEDVKQGIETKPEELILGKFKTVDDLKTAYQNLQKQQGEYYGKKTIRHCNRLVLRYADVLLFRTRYRGRKPWFYHEQRKL